MAGRANGEGPYAIPLCFCVAPWLGSPTCREQSTTRALWARGCTTIADAAVRTSHLLKRRNHDCVLPATHGESHTVDTFTGREFCPNCALWGNDKLLAADSDPQATTSMKNLVWTNQAAKRMLVCFTGLNSGCVIMPIKDNGNNFIGKTLSFVSAPRVAPRALHTRPRLEYVFFHVLG